MNRKVKNDDVLLSNISGDHSWIPGLWGGYSPACHMNKFFSFSTQCLVPFLRSGTWFLPFYFLHNTFTLTQRARIKSRVSRTDSQQLYSTSLLPWQQLWVECFNLPSAPEFPSLDNVTEMSGVMDSTEDELRFCTGNKEHRAQLIMMTPTMMLSASYY